MHPIDLKIRHGQFTTLLGPSGCGKTTLLRLIAGLERPDTGNIRFGEDVLASETREVPPERRGFGMVFQDFALWPHMTVFENVAFGPGPPGARTRSGIKSWRLWTRSSLAAWSSVIRISCRGASSRGGFCESGRDAPEAGAVRRAAKRARAVLRDEMRLEMMYLVSEMGLTALYVTHDQVEAMSMSDEVIVMHGGKVLQKGTPEEIYNQPRHPFVARFIGKSNWLADGRSMFRPEQIRFEPDGQDTLAYAATVEQATSATGTKSGCSRTRPPDSGSPIIPGG
ncbi:ABC transporter ATP-binding protein [Paenibacillus sp. JTLBN-2024]